MYGLGDYIGVHPTFLYESLGTFILFIILMKIKQGKFVGYPACIYFIGYGLIRTFVEGLRTDSLMLGNIRISQLVSLLILIFGIIAISVKSYQKKMSENEKSCHNEKEKNKK